MDLIPYPVGPLNPKVQDLFYALSLFAAVFLFFFRLLPRMQRVLDARDEAIRGTTEQAEAVRARAEERRTEAEAELAEARLDAARIRQEAFEQGVAVLAETRAEAHRERDALLAEGRSRIEADCVAAEAELRVRVAELASNLASRVVGEPLAPLQGRGAVPIRGSAAGRDQPPPTRTD